MKKRLFSIIIAAIIIISVIPLASLSVSAETVVFKGISIQYDNAAISDVASDKVIKYTENGALTLDRDIRARILIVGGGGSGSSGGSASGMADGYGGYGGGVVDKTVDIPAGTYNICIGEGSEGVVGTTDRVFGNSGKASSIEGENFFLAAHGGAGGSSTTSNGAVTSDITGVSVSYGAGGAIKSSGSNGNNAISNTGNGGEGGYKKGKSGAGASGIVIIRIIDHVHEFTYSVDPEDSTKLIATCVNDGCNIEGGCLKLGLVSEGAFDDGLDEWKRQGAKVPTITYYDSEGNIHEGDCFASGDYTVKASVGSAVAKKEFSIGSGHYHIVNGVATQFNTTTSLPTKSGNFFLSKNVTPKSSWNVPSGTVNLCLNGKVLTLGNNIKISVGTGCTLNIFDCGTKEYAFRENASTSTPGLWITATSATATHIVTGGVIMGGNAIKASGGAININGGTLNLYGGNIVGNSVTGSYNGGAVYVSNGGVFNMYDGAILGNYANSAGGGVYNFSVFNMYGGTIGYNATNSNGGGVLTAGVFNMYGGVIEENKATSTTTNNGRGGGVRVATGDFNMLGGIIRKNTATVGGGVQYAQGTVLGEVLAPFAGSATFGGNAVVSDNHLKDGTLQNMYVANEDQYSDNILITLAVGDEAPSEGMSVGIHMQTPGIFSFKSANAKEYLKYFSADNSGDYAVTVKDDALGMFMLYGIEVIPEHGKASADAEKALAGSTVTIDLEPDFGYRLASLKYNDGVSDYEITPNEEGEYIFVMPDADVTVTAVFETFIVVTLGAEINEESSSLRLGALYNGGLFIEDKDTRKAVDDFGDLGIVFYPSHLLGEEELTLETSGAAYRSAIGIVEYDEDKHFEDYESFVFYVTIVNIPEHGKDVNISFRPFITYGNGETEYDIVMERSFNYVKNVNESVN